MAEAELSLCKRMLQLLLSCVGRAESMQLFGERYRVERKLGEGATANVLLLRKTGGVAHGDALVALKVICAAREKRGAVETEIAALGRVRGSPLVLELLCSEILPTRNADVLEARLLFRYCEGGTALTALEQARSDQGGGLSEPAALEIFEQMAAAVAHCHARDVIHRDIKLTNVYLTSRNGTRMWVLGDFGSALLSAQSAHIAHRVELLCAREEVEELTTPEYRAPEQVALELGSRLSSAVDAWALGVSLHQMLFDANPFATPLATLSARAVTDKEHAASGGLQELLRELLQRNASSRLTAAAAQRRARALQREVHGTEPPDPEQGCGGGGRNHDESSDIGWANFGQ
uniref:non-specific serine/threonine protein kinase n=1 Tax=Calcidiscus leptoporus TaxID=127549 RepID=A0A7S0JB89_9EUKA|mmetsp:Transcript_49222/g.113760  ORF Transcript_49222/g.113760 Transcript_49222/m.113760 type:complete len:348 (+) Transcript_49222:944-1987(+)